MFRKAIVKVPFKVSQVLEPSRVCAVDNYLNRDWNHNEAGWLRNDIAALAAATTKEQYELILQRMKEFPVSSNLPKGVKLSEAFELIKPRSCQTEHEFVDFAVFLTEKGLKNIEAAYEVERLKQVDKPAEKVDVPAE